MARSESCTAISAEPALLGSVPLSPLTISAQPPGCLENENTHHPGIPAVRSASVTREGRKRSREKQRKSVRRESNEVHYLGSRNEATTEARHTSCLVFMLSAANRLEGNEEKWGCVLKIIRDFI
ncbi:unnamed protein product [Pleuronectes platessa]|uniref:Uncharacterized protein n=1 Tax=Pleuronectes platessa TaxID=8262 RepID=A0A9N7U2F6_PLEPL|nr:unnamed protein product [Pleuronectes platessa]